MFGLGISREGSLLDVAVDKGIVNKAGAWFTYDEVQLGQGKEKAKMYLRDNTDVAIQLENAVLKEVGLSEDKDNVERDINSEKEDKVIEE